MSITPIWATPEYQKKLALAKEKLPVRDMPGEFAFSAGFRAGWEAAVDALIESFQKFKKEENPNGQ